MSLRSAAKGMEELVYMVDLYNNHLGYCLRDKLKSGQIIFRSSEIFVLNSAHKLYVQKRSLTKYPFPGYYDVCPGGVRTIIDDSDEATARRELKEEMGIENTELKYLFDILFENSVWKWWGKVYLTFWDLPVTHDDEVSEIEMWDIEEVDRKIREGVQFTPTTLQAFPRFKEIYYREINNII